MIGDRKSDIEAARDNGIPFIGCAFGHLGSTEIEHERWVARRFDEIPARIHDIETSKFQ
jgi:phosphoglycolate phosphatase-like HAD superfamily hydrolase